MDVKELEYAEAPSPVESEPSSAATEAIEADAAETIFIVDRRGAARSERREQTAVFHDANEAGEAREIPAWLLNASEIGLLFRCRETLPQNVAVKIGSGEVLDALVVRQRQLADGLWEYGVKLLHVEADQAGNPDGNEWRHELIAVPKPKEQPAKSRIKRQQERLRKVSNLATKSEICSLNEPERTAKKRAYILAAIVFLLTASLTQIGLIRSVMFPGFIVAAAVCILGWIGVNLLSLRERRQIERAERNAREL